MCYILKMGRRSDRSVRKERDTQSVTAGQGRDAQREHILVETPQETSNAIARIKGLFIDIERKINEERKQKNTNAVALGARSASANKNQKRPTDPSGSSTSPPPA
jgi:hypothetical protein